jgi:hypothetical protein
VVDQSSGYTIADLDGDGSPEVISAARVYDARAMVRFEMEASTTFPIAADLVGDERLEVFTGRAAYASDGRQLWDRGPDCGPSGIAVARFPTVDASRAQLVSTSSCGLELLDGATGTVLRGPLPIPMGETDLSPPTIADYDGDDRPEIALVTTGGFLVVDLDIPAAGCRAPRSRPAARSSSWTSDSSTASHGELPFSIGDAHSENFVLLLARDGVLHVAHVPVSVGVRNESEQAP